MALAQDIGHVNKELIEMSNNSSNVNASANGLASLSEELKTTVEQFKV